MINQIVNEIITITTELIDITAIDIEDVKKANHEKLIERNEIKIIKMEQLAQFKIDLNINLKEEFQSGVDIKIYKDGIDNIELKLKELYFLNGKLGSIILPVKEMYKEIIDEITYMNGGSLVEVMA